MANPYLAAAAVTSAASTSLVAGVTTVPAAGDGLFAFCVANAGTGSGVSDTKGGTWTLLASETTAFQVYCYQRTAGSALTSSDSVTFSWTASGEAGIMVAGIPSFSSVDLISAVSGGSGTSQVITASGTTAQSSEAALVMVSVNNGSGGISSWSTGWAQLYAADAQPSAEWVALAWGTTGQAGSTLTATSTSASSASKFGAVIASFIQSGGPAAVSSADSGHGAEGAAIRVPGAEPGHGAEGAAIRVSGADSGHGAEGAVVRVTRAETGHAAEAGSASAAVAKGDAAHGAEAAALVRVTRAETGQAAEAGSARAALSGADTAHGTEAGSAGPPGRSSADSGHFTESAFYSRLNADAGHGSEAAGPVLVSRGEAAAAADVPAMAWPSSGDSGRAADRVLDAWPRGADAGHAGEAVRPFPGTGADSGRAGDAVHDIGIWTYAATGVRLLLPPPRRPDPAAAARLSEAVRRLSASVPWAVLHVSSADRARLAERGVIAGRREG